MRRASWKMDSSLHVGLSELNLEAMRLCSLAHRVCITVNWGCSVHLESPVLIFNLNKTKLVEQIWLGRKLIFFSKYTAIETGTCGTGRRLRKEVAIVGCILSHQQQTSFVTAQCGHCRIARAIDSRSVYPVGVAVKLFELYLNNCKMYRIYQKCQFEKILGLHSRGCSPVEVQRSFGQNSCNPLRTLENWRICHQSEWK